LTCYWDTSALLPLLFDEPRSKDMLRLASEGGGLPGYTSFFTLLEMEAAFSRKLGQGSLGEGGLVPLRAQARMLEEALALLWPDAGALESCRRLAMEFGLKPGDALQLGSALILAQGCQDACFVSLDARLNEAAAAAGLAAYLR